MRRFARADKAFCDYLAWRFLWRWLELLFSRVYYRAALSLLDGNGGLLYI